jgi:D-glycero-D-manno-heptose 1,7-bisphosphate phosphatase
MKKALFLDRDGVINIEKHHTFRKEEFEFTDGIFDLCKEYLDSGFIIIVITNQAGIAKGYYTEDDYNKLTKWMIDQFCMKGIVISKVYHCPHHPDITGPCDCRKPNPGMILQAIEEFDLDIAKCFLIGDKESDLQAGRNAGIPESNLIKYLPYPL